MYAGAGLAREVDGHERRRAAQKGEGRLRHALSADRQEARQPAVVGLVDNGDGIAIPDRELRETLARDRVAKLLARAETLVERAAMRRRDRWIFLFHQGSLQ